MLAVQRTASQHHLLYARAQWRAQYAAQRDDHTVHGMDDPATLASAIYSAVTSKDGHGASDVSWPCMSAKKHTGMCHVQCKLGLTAVISDLLRVIVCTVAVLVYDVHGLCQLAVHLAIAIVVLTRAGFSINVDLDELTRAA